MGPTGPDSWVAARDRDNERATITDAGAEPPSFRIPGPVDGLGKPREV